MPASSPRKPRPPRLFDLRIDWLVQYAPETTLFGPSAIETATRDLPRVEGYLGATSAAVLMLDVGARPDEPTDSLRRSLDDRIARVEAEFAGRLLLGPDDLARWRDDPNGLTWGVLGLAGIDQRIRSEGDLGQLDRLYARGVRVFQPVLADRELNALDRLVIERISNLATGGASGPRPILDLAGMGVAAAGEVLARFETEPALRTRAALMRSYGPMGEAERVGFLGSLRALGGLIGLGASWRSFGSAEALREALDWLIAAPFEGRPGFEGIGLATDAFGGAASLAGLETAPDLIAWGDRSFGPAETRALVRGNSEAFFSRWLA